MNDPGEHYKREAERLLSLARETSFAEVRQELTRLADQYRRLAVRLAPPFSSDRPLRQTG